MLSFRVYTVHILPSSHRSILSLCILFVYIHKICTLCGILCKEPEGFPFRFFCQLFFRSFLLLLHKNQHNNRACNDRHRSNAHDDPDNRIAEIVYYATAVIDLNTIKTRPARKSRALVIGLLDDPSGLSSWKQRKQQRCRRTSS